MTIAVAVLMFGSAAHAEILIATAAPMTGQRAWSGEQTRRGAELAVDDLNAAGGVLGQRLELVVGDDAADAGQAAAVARKLVSDGVVFVAGHRLSDASIAGAPVYAGAEVIQISPSSTNPKLTEMGYKTVFRVCGRDDQQGIVAGDYLAQNWGDKSIAIVHDGSTYGRDLAAQTRAHINARGVKEVLFEAYDAGQRDYSALVSRLQKAGVDVLYVGGYSPESALMIRQARDEDYALQLVSGDALHNSDFWVIAEEAGEGAVFTFVADPRDQPAAKDVVERFRASGYEPEGYTLHTYAAVQVWAQAVEKAQSLESEKVVRALQANSFDTVLGPLRFDAKGDLVEHDFVWYRWKDGKYVRND